MLRGSVVGGGVVGMNVFFFRADERVFGICTATRGAKTNP
jgi:hypothetical protein